MKSKLIGVLVAAAFALPVSGYAADGKTRTFVKDSVITTKIKAELAKEKPSTLAKVSVDTDNAGVVVLSGSAKTQRGELSKMIFTAVMPLNVRSF